MRLPTDDRVRSTDVGGMVADMAIEAPEQLRILLVDDSQLFRERLARAFCQRGFEVQTAVDADDALEKARQWRPDLAIVDLRMPGRSGLDLVSDLRELDESIQVLVLSGFGSIATAVDAVKLGAVNFLSKPADADQILAAFGREPNAVPLDTESMDAPSLARIEWEHIHRVLSDCEGNISEAARRLGIHRRSLQRKLRKRAPD